MEQVDNCPEENSPLSTMKTKDFNEDDGVSLKMSIQIENSSLKTGTLEPLESSNILNTDVSDYKKKKVKDEKPQLKTVIRRLPPTMTKAMFLEQVSPLPEIDYLYFIQGDMNNLINPFSRAYLNFVVQEDLLDFSRTFDNYVFLDTKGQEYPAIVEFAMFQRVPKPRTKKKDSLMNTIEADPTYISFKENLLAEALENSKTGGKAVKQHFFETEISTTEEVNSTPLLEFLKMRRAEKARIREERREEKKRKEVERKLKQKTKDRKGEGDEEELSKDSKIQYKSSESYEKVSHIGRNKQANENGKKGKSNEDRSKSGDKKMDINENSSRSQDRKFSILVKNAKEGESEPPKGNTDSGNHSPCKPCALSSSGETNSVPDAEIQKIKEAEVQTIYLRKLLGLNESESPQGMSLIKNEVQMKDRREIQTGKEREGRSIRKKDERELIKEIRPRGFKGRGGKSYQEERQKLAERREEQKKKDLLYSSGKQDISDQNEMEGSELEVQDQKATEADNSGKFDKKKYDYRKKYDEDWKDEKKRYRSEKNNTKREGRDRNDYRRNMDKKGNDADSKRKTRNFNKNSDSSKNIIEDKKKKHFQKYQSSKSSQSQSPEEHYESNKFDDLGEGSISIESNTKNKWRSIDDLDLYCTTERRKCDYFLSDGDINETKVKRHTSLEDFPSVEFQVTYPKKVTLLQREREPTKDTNDNKASNYRSRKDFSTNKSTSDSKNFSSKKRVRNAEKQEENKEGNEMKGSKNRKQGSEGEGTKSKDLPRSERRIRNKDRPSIEIYRPGMGRFSKQRLEKEKALGSSTEVESPSHSPSPTPKAQ